MALRSPSRERRASVSSRSSPASNELRSRRKIDSSPLADYNRPILESPYNNDEDEVDADIADRRNKRIKRKDKKHKRDRKSKKKKKRSKHHSRSTSVDSSDSGVNAATAHEQQEAVLSDWETAPSTAAATITTAATASATTVDDKIDTSACSPVSNDSHIASPDEPPPLVDEVEGLVRGRGRRTPPSSPPVALLRGEVPMRESPHTPPLLPPGRAYGLGARERSLTPLGGLGHERERGSRLG